MAFGPVPSAPTDPERTITRLRAALASERRYSEEQARAAVVARLDASSARAEVARLTAALARSEEQRDHLRSLLTPDPHETQGSSEVACPWGCGHLFIEPEDHDWRGVDTLWMTCERCGESVNLTAVRHRDGTWVYTGRRGRTEAERKAGQ